jgi:hypothetical protein
MQQQSDGKAKPATIAQYPVRAQASGTQNFIDKKY